MDVPIRIAVAALVRDGRILLGHRHPARENYPDCWDFIGGHIEPGESAEAAVIRECLEEIGVRIRDPRPVPVAFSDPRLEIHTFLVHDWDGEPVNAQPDEHDELGWFSAEQVQDLTLADEASRPELLAMIRLST